MNGRVWRFLPWLMGILILKVTVWIVSNYGEYVPPNFRSDFLTERDAYFWGAYAWAFYVHIVTGPITLVIGLLLISKTFLTRFRLWHRYLGRIQVFTILCLLTPSGLWMSWYAATGGVAAVGFASLAIATATSAAIGWRLAVRRKFQEHQRWMWRCFLLLSSAVVLRLTAGLSIVIGQERDWIYPMSAWVSWLGPLAVNELWLRFRGSEAYQNITQLIDESH